MILQTIKLPFDAGTADTIYTKQGETGRGVWFDLPFLIGEEEIPDYKAEFIAVKPDDTFVIEDATLTNHGDGDDLHSVCYLTLPEQVSAAKGTGSYILKIYDYAHDDDLIYSAAGGLYVDDHLLLDSMIESIAEVNGYNFPDDFLTIGDLGAIINDNVTAEDTTWSSHKIDEEITDAAAALQDEIDDLIDDNATSADTTWSSQKISDTLWHRYSTTEHVVGTWIDGSTIYEKTIVADTIYNDNNWHSIPHGIDDFNVMVDMKASAYTISGVVYTYYAIPSPRPFLSPSMGFCITATHTDIEYINNWVNAMGAFFTIQYTKSN